MGRIECKPLGATSIPKDYHTQKNHQNLKYDIYG